MAKYWSTLEYRDGRKAAQSFGVVSTLAMQEGLEKRGGMAIYSLGSGGRVPRSRLSRPSLALVHRMPPPTFQGFLSRFLCGDWRDEVPDLEIDERRGD